jgi:signal transduction histidine kinase
MSITDAVVREERHFILSSLPPSQAQKRLAVCIVLGLLAALYLVLGPFGGMRLGAVRSFVAIYATAMFMTEFITAILLYAQFSILRSRAILVIASGYLFTALLIVPYTLAFPGVLAQDGVVGDMQTSARLYLLWHCGFPLFVICYALLKDEDAAKRVAQGQVRAAILRAVAGTVVLAAVAAFVCIKGAPVLPRIQLDAERFVPQWLYVVGMPIGLLCAGALGVLWLRRRSILDLFLMVVLCAYLIEIPPHYFPAPMRFSTGWYAVRVTGFLSSSVVLIVLLYEISALYGALLGAVLDQRRERGARLVTGDAVAATIAHEVRQPLTAMVTSADAGLRFLERSHPNLDKAKEALRAIVADGHRAAEVVRSIRENFKSDVRDRTELDVNDLIHEALDLGRDALQKHGIVVQAEQDDQLPKICGNRIQLQQVLLNLITNGAEAMAAVNGPRILSVKSRAHEGDRVSVSVADTGTGIDAQSGAHIFAPLYTTKADGMGMGLSICRAIVEAHEGRLWFSENIPHGAVFHFTLQANSVIPSSA